MTKMKRIAASILFCVILIACGKFFRYILNDDTSSYTRIMFHEMYEQDNIDVLFVGSSHCYRSIIPEIMDAELGVNTFNAGTSSQQLDGSYMVIKEAERHNDIDHIYLELYYNGAFSVYKNRSQMTQTYIISDYLKPSIDKIQYLLNASSKEHYINSFILARRNWSKIFEEDYIKNLIIRKASDDYKNYEYTYVTRETEWYSGKGYVANKQYVEDWNFFSNAGYDKINLDNVSRDWLATLEDIIDFCDKRGISLTLISAPMSNYLLAGSENYDEYIALVKELVSDTDVEYYDFNLCRDEYFPNKSELFKDNDHLNCDGAEIFSHLLAAFINGEIQETELFYNSYQEKINNLAPTVFGVSYHDERNDNWEKIRNCKIVSTGNSFLEYEIVLTSENGETKILQEYSDNRFFTVTPEEHGTITIRYRSGNHTQEEKSVNISY